MGGGACDERMAPPSYDTCVLCDHDHSIEAKRNYQWPLQETKPINEFVFYPQDKEALLDDIIELKLAFEDQSFHLKLHKAHATSMRLENK